MRIMIVFVGILTVLGGIWPLIKDASFMPPSLAFIPSTGIGYQAIIIVIGLIAVLYGVKQRDTRPIR